MLLNTLLTTVLSSSKLLHQCVTSGGSITLGCAPIATSANSKLSVGQSACDVYATIVWLCGSCYVAIVWNFGSWTLTVVICKWLYRDTVFYIKANSSDCLLSYRQHIVRCRCIQNSTQSNCWLNFGDFQVTSHYISETILGRWLSWYASDSHHDTVFYIKANSSDCPLSYRQHVVRCRCIQNSIQSDCCSTKLSTSFLLNYDPVAVQLFLGVDYTL